MNIKRWESRENSSFITFNFNSRRTIKSGNDGLFKSKAKLVCLLVMYQNWPHEMRLSIEEGGYNQLDEWRMNKWMLQLTRSISHSNP